MLQVNITSDQQLFMYFPFKSESQHIFFDLRFTGITNNSSHKSH